MAPIFQPFWVISLLVLLGAFLRRRQVLEEELIGKLSQLVIDVTLPAMLFISMYNNISLGILSRALWFPVIGFGASLLILLSTKVTRKVFLMEQKTWNTFSVLCTNGNTVFIPVPIVLALFGPEALLYTFLFELGAGFYYWSFGVNLLRGKPFQGINPQVFNLNFLALLLGSVLGISGVGIPQVLAESLQILANVTVGMAMLITGGVIYGMVSQKVYWRPEVIGVIIHRLVLSPLIGLALLLILSLDYQGGIVLMLQLSTPPLLTTALLAMRFDADHQLAALGVVITTILSLVTIPLTLSLADILFFR